MPRMTKKVSIAVATAVLSLVVMTGCTGGSSGQQKETKTQQDNYDRLVAQDPAHVMANSPTRQTINKWIDTWGKDPNKLAYVYMQNSNGDLIGFYVFKGLPVSYCTSLTPNYRIYNGDKGDTLTPAPSIDGVYYSGGQCNSYYGFDATSGAYIEYTAGLGINVLIYDQPLTNRPNVPNLAPR